ncbi:MAG: magnesium transporter [Thermoplasmatales archaeon]|nr:MAG: magnesium transporter [Thermoplasmatales archaeon]
MIYSWKKIVKHGLPLLTVTILIEIFAGQILQGKQEALLLFPVFLISIPVINSISGNIGSVLGARIASGLHVGYINLSLKDKEIHDNFLISILIGLITYLILAIVIYFLALFGNLIEDIALIEFVAIIILTGFLLISVVSFISVLTAFISFKRGLDPDDMVAPVVTTVGDVMGIIFLFIVIGLIGVGI